MTSTISLKVFIDKEKDQVVYAEAEEDFVDVLFSFLTIPIGTILKLASKFHNDRSPPTLVMGSMDNLYKSVEAINSQLFRSSVHKASLLSPRNCAEFRCVGLKLDINAVAEANKYFRCLEPRCSDRLLSYYRGVYCDCGGPMISETRLILSDTLSFIYSGVFVDGPARFIISDDLRVMIASTGASFSLFSNHGLVDGSAIEERTVHVSEAEVVNLLVRSLASRTPLTETFVKSEESAELNNTTSCQVSSTESQANEGALNMEEKITVKLMVSKSKNTVCYAEAGKDFVDLLFSFLAVPLGYVVKNMKSCTDGSISQLYNSVLELDDKSFNLSSPKEVLIHPRLAFGLGYKNDLLGVEEGSDPCFGIHYASDRIENCVDILTIGYIPCPLNFSSSDSLSLFEQNFDLKDVDGQFLKGPTMFLVTDSLIVTPFSSSTSLSILNGLNIPFNDIEEMVVHVGKKEALSLLLSSFGSESALTNVFITVPMQCQE